MENKGFCDGIVTKHNLWPLYQPKKTGKPLLAQNFDFLAESNGFGKPVHHLFEEWQPVHHWKGSKQASSPFQPIRGRI